MKAEKEKYYCLECGRRLHGISVNFGNFLCPKCRYKCHDCNVKISKNRTRCRACHYKNITGKNHYFYGHQHSVESKEKNRIAHLGKTPWLGKHHSPESRKKIGQREYPSGENNIFYHTSLEEIWAKKYGKEKAKEMIKEMYAKRDFNGSKNPFYNKVHTERTKNQIRKSLEGKFVGEKNPFYGKKHPKILQDKLNEKIRIYQNRPEIKENNRQRALNNLAKGKYRKTIPEKLVETWLKQHNINYKYSFILLKTYQYDFQIINTECLIEVHGDYWHANPKFYGAGKKSLNWRQLSKIETDIKKLDFAAANGYKIIVIWENDIKNNNFEVFEKEFHYEI